MIDLHSHIIPGVDDGSPDYETSLAMLEIAAEDGIRTIAGTPHFIPGAFAPSAAEVRTAVGLLKEKVKAAGIDIEITGAHEVRTAAGLLQKLRNDEILTYDKSKRYLLLEMPGSSIPAWMDKLIFELEVGDIIPVIAHPERNAGVIKNPMLFYELVQKGCRSQITAGSITGRFGERVRETAHLLLRHRMAHIVASDAHDAEDRTPVLSMARATVAEMLGEPTAKALFEVNPRRILDGDEFYAPDPKPIEEDEEKDSALFGLFRRLFEK
ncbi:MAG: CpsB/CapC family capsule biosynthesis tyrosine phosphatase [Candidatus Hydrogenedentota bacterium]